MIASAPSQPSAPSAARTLGTMPPAMTPDSMSVSASPTVSASSRWPSASRTPSTSVSSTSWRAPRPAAIPAATSSALTLQTIPSASRASGATTGTWPPTRIASSRSRRRPTTDATRPSLGMRSAISRPPSTPDRPDGIDAEVAQAGHELAVDDAAQDRGGHLERLGVRDAEAALERARDAEALEPFGDALAAAMDQDHGTSTRDRGHFREDLATGPRWSCRRA